MTVYDNPSMKRNVRLAIRLPEDLVKEVDGTARHLERIQDSGVRVTRSDAVRYLLRSGINHMNSSASGEWGDKTKVVRKGRR